MGSCYSTKIMDVTEKKKEKKMKAKNQKNSEKIKKENEGNVKNDNDQKNNQKNKKKGKLHWCFKRMISRNSKSFLEQYDITEGSKRHKNEKWDDIENPDEKTSTDKKTTNESDINDCIEVDADSSGTKICSCTNNKHRKGLLRRVWSEDKDDGDRLAYDFSKNTIYLDVSSH